jgi:hypothetical protein
MRGVQILLSTILLLAFAASAAGQAQPPQLERASIVTTSRDKTTNPCDVNPDGKIDVSAEADKNTRLTRLYANVVPVSHSNKANKLDGGAVKSFVAVYVLTNLGPIGEAYVPAGLDAFKKLDEGRETKYYYPSLFFDMSASPMLSPTFSGDVESKNYDEQIKKVSNKNLNLRWMDMTAELFPWCGANAQCPQDALRVLEVMPNATRGGTHDSLPTQLGGAAGDIAKLAPPFFPASTFDDKATAVTGGITVLFRNLFPPKTETYFHGFVVSQSSFGWNFRENKSKPEEASVMGLHRGVVLLQANQQVKRIRIISSTLTEWNGAPNPYSNRFDRRADDVCVWIPEKKNDAPDFTKLADLDAFPFLIPKQQVMLILQTNDAGYDELTKGSNGHPPMLETGPSADFVKKSSLEKYLGIEKKKADEKKPGDESNKK